MSKHLRLLLLVLAAALGALDSWSSRHSLNPMGVSYLDMGDAFVRRDWQTALNGLWSPLYSLPLGLLVRVFRPSPSTEFPLVHFANFLIYLTALFAFTLFMRERRKSEIDIDAELADSTVPRPALAQALAGSTSGPMVNGTEALLHGAGQRPEPGFGFSEPTSGP